MAPLLTIFLAIWYDKTAMDKASEQGCRSTVDMFAGHKPSGFGSSAARQDSVQHREDSDEAFRSRE
jgi:hypothetical protein